MAQYDGAIRIATKITTKDAEESLASLEWQIKKSAKYMDELRSKMDALKDQKIPTKEYKKMQEDLSKAEKALSDLVKKQTEMESLGISSGNAWDALNEKVAIASDNVDSIKAKMQDLVDAGKGFTLGKDTAEYASYEKQLQYEEEIVRKAAEHYKKLLRASEGYKKLGDATKKAFSIVYSVLKKANSLVDSFGKRIKEAFSKFTKSATGAVRSANGFSLSLKNILKYGFGIRSLYVLVNKLRSGIKEGFTNLLTYSQSLENSVNGIKANALTLKNAFAAAFSPFVEVALPYVQKLLDYMVQLTNMAGQFFAAITGRKTYIKAIKQSTEALKEETKEMYKQLSPLDKLNNLSSQKDKGSDKGAGGTMFEEVPIDNSILDMAEKIKDILSKLFAPLKEAWNREGKFVMDSWKYALNEVWKLIKDIGRDFLEVWQQEKTIKIFEDILHIIGDIGLVVGNLARNFREAWNENKTGMHILENIRDIIGVIVHNIRLAADKTVEWADKLNFNPVLQAFERFTKSLIPLAGALSGILADFYTEVLLPLAKWTIEKGLPELLDVFTAFNEKVDWQALRDNLSEFWRHLEPFAETVGEGLIIFIGRLTDALANFLNSQEFKDFLVMIEDWMDSVTPEDVADALEKIAKALITLKLAVLGFGALSAVTGVLTTIKSFLSFFGVGGAGATAAKGIEGTTTAIGGLADALGILKTTLGAGFVFDLGIKNKEIDALEKITGDTETADKMRERYGSLGGAVNILKDSFYVLRNAVMGYGAEVDGVEGKERALAKAMEDTSNGRIMSDKNLEVLQSRFKATSEDIEMLRQNMLDMHPEIRNIADTFDFLGDASAQSLREIYEGLKYADSGISSTDEIAHKLVSTFGQEVTPTTKNFFNAWFKSSGRLSDSFYEFQTGEQVIDGYVTSLKDASGAIEQFGDDITAASTNIGEGLTTGMEKVDTDSPASGFFSKLVASIKSVFGIHSPATTMEPFGENILLGVLEGFRSRFAEFTTLISQLFTQISSKFTNGMNAVKSIWTNAWNSLPNIVKNIINSITSMVSGFISSISNSFSKIGSLASRSGGWFSGSSSSIRSSAMSAASPYSTNPAFATLAAAPIPKLATGAVIPPNKEFLAVLGDQKHGTNIEAPLEMIEQANKKSLLGVLEQLGITGGGNSNQTINLNLTVECEGYQLLHIIQKLDEEYFKQHGKHAFT